MVLYVEGFGRRIQAEELSKVSSGLGWMVGGADMEDLAREDIWHEVLEHAHASSEEDQEEEEDEDEEASLAATATAAVTIDEETFVFARDLAGVLDHANLPASEADTVGRIVVFSDERSSGLPSAEACVDALGLKHDMGEIHVVAESTVTPKDWHAKSNTGFCYHYLDEEELDEADTDTRKIRAATGLLASELSDHFEFNMSETIVCAPVLYGGRHGNSGAIVAVLSMRVWT